MPAIAKVEPLTSTRALRGPFDYLLTDELRGVEVGALLEIPFARRRVLGVVTGLADRSDVPAAKLASPFAAVGEGVPGELVELAAQIAAEYCSTFARALGLVLPPGGGAVSERFALHASIAAAGIAALRDGERLGTRQRAVLERLAADGAMPATLTGADHGTLRRLENRGLIELARGARARRPEHRTAGAVGAVPELTGEQSAALAPIAAAIAEGKGGGFLLHGVTGSGKTEVYLRAAQDALQRGRGVIVLVPEIGLTPQLAGRFRARFGDTVAVLHSNLGQGERYDEWLRLRRGEARVCVGPRSAVFAPVERLGLIVVDEEHDASYKHEGDPRYDARAVAAWRAAREHAVLVHGSATPRPESVRTLPRLHLAQRVDGRPLPPVEVLDMRGHHGPLHPRTVESLGEVARAGGKAIVLLNRRGWSNFLECRRCGHVWECPQCDVSLVLHQAQGSLACHHCGHREHAPSRCTACGSPEIGRHGAGTERVEAELGALVGSEGFPIVRLDADAAASKDGVAALLERFDRAPAGVLLGTQMVAKGHDFPEVTLGVVLDADSTLRFPDFRAEERTFALVTQLAGRAGRGDAGGRVLVQTVAPEAEAIVRAARHDADGFLAGELERRSALAYPPFADLIRIVCSAPEPGRAMAAASVLAPGLAAPGADVLGPAPLFRLRGRERAQLVVKASDRAAAVAAAGAAVDAAARDRSWRGVSFSVDVDPQ